MIDPNAYVLIQTHRRIPDGPETSYRHRVVLSIMDEENDKFNDVVDALIAKDKKEYPEDYIILPCW